MSAIRYKLLKALYNVNVCVRHISTHTSKFSRGTRFSNPNTSSSSTEKDVIKNKNANLTSLVETEVIILDKKEIMFERVENSQTKISSITKPPSTPSETSLFPFYEKLGNNDSKFSSIMMMLKSRKDREQNKLILLEGERLIQDALNAGIKPHSIYFSRKESIKDLNVPKSVHHLDIFKIQYKQIQLWSHLTTSPGIVGVFEKPKQSRIMKRDDMILPVTLVCDNVREPGNLGAILRVAAGVGCQEVLLTKGCIDLWEPKVLRSGAGAHFRVNVEQNVDWELLETQVREKQASVYLADNKASSELGLAVRDYCDVDFASNSAPSVLVLGGETEGLSTHAHRLASLASYASKLHVPLCGGVESLNVATALAVIMFEMRRQQKIPILSSDQSSYTAVQ